MTLQASARKITLSTLATNTQTYHTKIQYIGCDADTFEASLYGKITKLPWSEILSFDGAEEVKLTQEYADFVELNLQPTTIEEIKLTTGETIRSVKKIHMLDNLVTLILTTDNLCVYCTVGQLKTITYSAQIPFAGDGEDLKTWLYIA